MSTHVCDKHFCQMWYTCVLCCVVHVILNKGLPCHMASCSFLSHDGVMNGKHFFALLAFFAGSSPVTGEFPSHSPVARSFDAFYDLRLNKRLSKQWRGWRLRRHHAHYDVTIMVTYLGGNTALLIIINVMLIKVLSCCKISYLLDFFWG